LPAAIDGPAVVVVTSYLIVEMRKLGRRIARHWIVAIAGPH
jgi:hypothetical protein